MNEKGGGTIINLLCPSSSELLRFVALEGDGVDVGTISRSFGLDPSTVTLNGHYVSREKMDFISSLTWRSLLSFFRSRGFSTGYNPQNAVLVQGKPSKDATPIDEGNDVSHCDCEIEENVQTSKRKAWIEELIRTQLLKKRRTNECEPGLSLKSKEVLHAFYGATSVSLSCADGGLKRLREDEMTSAPHKRIR